MGVRSKSEDRCQKNVEEIRTVGRSGCSDCRRLIAYICVSVNVHQNASRRRVVQMTNLNCRVIDYNFVVPSFDQTAAEVLELFARLDQQVAACRRESYGNTFSRIACPNIQPWIPGTAMNGEEVEIGVESSKNGILLAILDEIRCSWCKQVRAL